MVEITRTFDVKHDVAILTLEFDNILGEYPGTVRVDYYSDESIVASKTVSVDNYAISVEEDQARDVNKIVITVLSVLPDYRVRLNKIGFFETDFTVDFNSIKQDSQDITKLEKLKNVNVNEYSYVTASETSKLFEITTDAESLHVEYAAATNVSISVSGGSLISSQIYGRAADLVLSSGTKTVVINGNTINESVVMHTYNYNVNGEDDNEANPLITSKEMADALAEHVATYLQLRNTYSSQYRGEPAIETGDIIGVETEFESESYGLILTNSLKFNGSWSGTLTVKGLK